MAAMIKEFVGTGEYVVRQEQPRILSALLGSCVGVALCDRQAGVGGMIHLLLAEPSGEEGLSRPGYYASTGLPRFIRELISKGADKNRLEATIAGGALVGQVSDLDLRFDIGGRTSGKAREILTGEGIRIRQSETGGYLGTSLNLNLKTWQTQITPIVPREESNPEPPPPGVNRANITEALGQVRPVPQVALKIIRLINKGTYDWSAVADEVRKEQVIGARVLHLCNSAAMGLVTHVDSIDRALFILGEQNLMQLTVSAACQDYFVQSDTGYSFTRGGLYRHAVGTALLSERLAEFTGLRPPGLAYTAGLLHDIGKVVLDQFVARANPFFYRRADKEGVALEDIEKEALGMKHTEAGLWLAKRWSLPKNLQEVISRHHAPDRAWTDPELTTLIHVADLLMSRFHVGLELDLMRTEHLAGSLDQIGLQPERFPELVELIAKLDLLVEV